MPLGLQSEACLARAAARQGHGGCLCVVCGCCSRLPTAGRLCGHCISIFRDGDRVFIERAAAWVGLALCICLSLLPSGLLGAARDCGGSWARGVLLGARAAQLGPGSPRWAVQCRRYVCVPTGIAPSAAQGWCGVPPVFPQGGPWADGLAQPAPLRIRDALQMPWLCSPPQVPSRTLLSASCPLPIPMLWHGQQKPCLLSPESRQADSLNHHLQIAPYRGSTAFSRGCCL